MEDVTTSTPVRRDIVRSQHIKMPRTQPTVRLRNYNSMSPRIATVASPSPSGASSASGRAIMGGFDLHKAEYDSKEDLWQSMANSSSNPNTNAIQNSTSNASTTSSVSEFTLDNATSATRERTSSVSSVDSFTTSYEPSEVTAAKLKATIKELNATEHNLKLIQGHATQLKSKLDDVKSAKSKEDKAQLEEIAQLRAANTASTAAHNKVTDELKGEILKLHTQMKETAESFAKQEVTLSDKITALEARLDESAAAQTPETKKHHDKMAALQSQMETAETAFTKEKAALVQKIDTMQVELETVNATVNEERKAHLKELSATTSKLQAAIQLRDHLLQSSSQIAKNNDCHLENIKCLEKELKEAEEASLSISVQLSKLEREHASLSEENGNTQRRLEEVLKEREATKQEAVMLKQGNTQKDKSAAMDELLDELQGLREGTQSQANSEETACLHTKVLALEEARVIEVAVISHLFEENSFLRAQVSVLQSEQQIADEPHNVTDQQALDLRNEKEAALKDNEILTAQLVEIKKLAEFAQDQVLRMEQDRLENQEIFKLLETFKEVQNDPKKDDSALDDALHSVQEENVRLLSEIDGLKSLFAKKQAIQESCQTKLTELESKSRTLKDDLKTEQLAHGSTRQELASAKMKIQLQAAAIDTNAEKVSKLEDQIEIERPLVQAGIRARQLWWELSKQRKHSNDSAADNALFVLGVMNSPADRSIYKVIYRSPVQSDARKVALSGQLSEILSMAATLRNRCRIRANFPNEYTDSAQFKAMEEWCRADFDRRMNEAGLDENSSRAEKKAVRDAFDTDATVRTYVSRMKEIFERAMEDFPHPSVNFECRFCRCHCMVRELICRNIVLECIHLRNEFYEAWEAEGY
ncbi:hypothetical protein DL98DRAFT_655839 [Cadophora sp. DSE1049]|nr:hypothetical protein DL98DRAFT_655839 [Cadophora sp. DSE1049]